MATDALASAKAAAVAYPRPDAPPVTTAVFPSILTPPRSHRPVPPVREPPTHGGPGATTGSRETWEAKNPPQARELS